MTAEEIGSRLLNRDALMLVIDKRAGLPVHPGPKGGETLFDHLDALRLPAPPPGGRPPPRQGYVGLPRPA